MDNIPTLDQIKSVVFNQTSVSQGFLDLYEGQPTQFELLVIIIAEAQRVDPGEEGFRLFVLTWQDSWNNWAMTAKAFREWLATTHYTYESTTPEDLSRLFLEELISKAAPR